MSAAKKNTTLADVEAKIERAQRWLMTQDPAKVDEKQLAALVTCLDTVVRERSEPAVRLPVRVTTAGRHVQVEAKVAHYPPGQDGKWWFTWFIDDVVVKAGDTAVETIDTGDLDPGTHQLKVVVSQAPPLGYARPMKGLEADDRDEREAVAGRERLAGMVAEAELAWLAERATELERVEAERARGIAEQAAKEAVKAAEQAEYAAKAARENAPAPAPPPPAPAPPPASASTSAPPAAAKQAAKPAAAAPRPAAAAPKPAARQAATAPRPAAAAPKPAARQAAKRARTPSGAKKPTPD